MKRVVLYMLGAILIGVGIFFLVQLYNSFGPEETGAIQISSNVDAQVYIDGKLAGSVPFCQGDFSICKEESDPLPVGIYEVKLVPEDESLNPHTMTVDVFANVMTAVDRTFLPEGLASSYVLTLVRDDGNLAGLRVKSIPDDALVSVDGAPVGVTTYEDGDISPSEHEIEIEKDGFAKKTIRVRTVEGYTLRVDVVLGAENPDIAGAREAQNEEDEIKTQEVVTILDTPVGFLRVREGAGIGFSEITTVEPGEVFPYISSENGWYEIELGGEVSGWVSEEYAALSTEEIDDEDNEDNPADDTSQE